MTKALSFYLDGPGWGRAPIHDFSGHVLSALSLGASWTLSAQPGFNLPFWSLNCEAWCYVLLALRLLFMDGNEFWR